MIRICKIILNVFFLLFFFTNLAWSQAPNDQCENAISLDEENGGCYFNASLVLATTSIPASLDCNSALVQDVWFSFLADSTFHNISVNPSAGMDAVVEVRKGDNCNGQFIACIDQGGGDGKVENLSLSNLIKNQLYFIRIYDFTGVGNPPSSWTFDICISGFEPTITPEIQLLNPMAGDKLEAGTILTIEADVNGVIAGKEIAFSSDNGANWDIIWQSSSPNPEFRYDWVVPSISSNQCIIQTTVFQSGEAFSARNDSLFEIFTNPNPSFKLSDELSHLYWPFYNPAIFSASDFHVASTWQNQENGVLITKDNIVNTWFFLNDHYWQNSGRWHHSGDNCFAQDWNFINGGNSDCQMYFFSPMDGKILFTKDACFNNNCGAPTCTNGCGNYIVVQSADDPSYAFRACHFSELNPELTVGLEVKAGDWLARVGNEGSSSAAHVHFVLYKNLNVADIDRLASGNTLQSNSNQAINPNNIAELCFEKAANFRFDAILNEVTTPIKPVKYDPVYQISLFPNPSKGQFNISINTNATQFLDVEIFNPIGQKIYKLKRKNYLSDERIYIDLSERISGIYLVKVKLDQEILTKKCLLLPD